MNRPRNRQPRGEDSRGGRGRGPRGSRGGHGGSRGSHSGPDYKPVPSMQQVVPGASVSMILKEDQSTGREVQGIVQDLLTRGNHPRGIKVRLTDGKVGRVQRMSSATLPAANARAGDSRTPVFKHVADVRYEDEYAEGPPPRTFADFMPSLGDEREYQNQTTEPTLTTATSKCPICEEFEGDEVAVSRHVEEHFTDAPCA